jgi:hypothetical protein
MRLYIEYYSIPYSLSAELTQATRKVPKEKMGNCSSCFSSIILLFYLQTPISLGNKLLKPHLFFHHAIENSVRETINVYYF